MTIKPEPVPTKIVCSVCGLDWGDHGEKPTLATCIELLKDELRRPRYIGTPSSTMTVSPEWFGPAQ